MTQAYIQAAVRFLIVFGCAGVVLFALEMSKPEPKHWCDIQTMECYNNLAKR